jgi:hypothetical protein
MTQMLFRAHLTAQSKFGVRLLVIVIERLQATPTLSHLVMFPKMDDILLVVLWIAQFGFGISPLEIVWRQ